MRGCISRCLTGAAPFLFDGVVATWKTERKQEITGMIHDLGNAETELVGMWLDLGIKVTGDAVSDRVEWLTATRLEKLAENGELLAELYRDPHDGRFWGKILPFAGGPPTLRVLSPMTAGERFGPSL
jgi:hypothetical protein